MEKKRKIKSKKQINCVYYIKEEKMVKINLQMFGGRGARSGGRQGGGGGLKAGDILSTTSLVSERENDEYYSVAGNILGSVKDVYDEYGLQLDDMHIAELKQSANAIAYYDGANIGWNKTFMSEERLNASYADCVEAGFHPSNGKRTPAEAVAYHELGHALTDAVGRKMGVYNIDSASTRIVNEARKQTSHRGVVQMASKISGYATHSNAEAIAEAFADFKCNGTKAKSESKAIVNVINSYLKGTK